jgi:hypothetical protein
VFLIHLEKHDGHDDEKDQKYPEGGDQIDFAARYFIYELFKHVVLVVSGMCKLRLVFTQLTTIS